MFDPFEIVFYGFVAEMHTKKYLRMFIDPEMLHQQGSIVLVHVPSTFQVMSKGFLFVGEKYDVIGTEEDRVNFNEKIQQEKDYEPQWDLLWEKNKLVDVKKLTNIKEEEIKKLKRLKEIFPEEKHEIGMWAYGENVKGGLRKIHQKCNM